MLRPLAQQLLVQQAKLGHEGNEPFIIHWILAAKLKLSQFNAQELANSMWAAATLGIIDEPFISHWLLVAKAQLPKFNAQALATSLWAAGTLGIRDEPFISSLRLAAQVKLPEFNAKDFAMPCADIIGLGLVLSLSYPV
eukprot:gene5432-biopygen4632